MHKVYFGRYVLQHLYLNRSSRSHHPTYGSMLRTTNNSNNGHLSQANFVCAAGSRQQQQQRAICKRLPFRGTKFRFMNKTSSFFRAFLQENDFRAGSFFLYSGQQRPFEPLPDNDSNHFFTFWTKPKNEHAMPFFSPLIKIPTYMKTESNVM